MFNTKEKIKKQFVAEVDGYLKELREEREEAYSKLEGYSKAKDRFSVASQSNRIEKFEAQINAVEILRIRVSYL